MVNLERSSSRTCSSLEASNYNNSNIFDKEEKKKLV